MSNSNIKSNNFYWMKLKKQISKAGKVYYTGNFAYAVDVVGFEKDDGTITLWLAPKDMDKMKQEQGRKQYQQPQAPRPPPVQQQRPPQPQALPPPYEDGDPGPEGDLPF